MAPTSTYRVQLHPGFQFADAAAVVGYLADLGLSHLYCSPYLQAAPGSSHGYDVTDPQRFNVELGGAAGHAQLHEALVTAGMGEVLDIVPNHMATDPSNPWWWDVLENGRHSGFAHYFDIDWASGAERILVPVLGDHYGRLLEAGEIVVRREDSRLVVRYGEVALPLAPHTLAPLFAAASRREGGEALAGFAERFESLAVSRATDPSLVPAEAAVVRQLLEELAQRCAADEGLCAALDGQLAEVSGDPEQLDGLLQAQHYRLAYWRVASEELHYRRFFSIETLAGVRIEDPEVFEATHRLVLALAGDGTLSGLRVDHLDGLREPEGYLERLAEAAGGVWTVVEKILEPGETLPRRFLTAGTSGYDFLTRVNNAFVASESEKQMTELYQHFTGELGSYDTVLRAAKQQVMASELAVEVERLTGLLAGICARHRRQRDHTWSELRSALSELVASYGVYRTYQRPGQPASPAEREHVTAALERTRAARPDLDGELLGFLAELAIGDHTGTEEIELALRLQQLTAPVMAKGAEDTAFYRYNRLVSLNEVGGDPGVFGRPLADFHSDTAAAAEAWPEAMLTISTHDTKRSADVRARINVLSELPDGWAAAVERFAEVNERHWGRAAPDRNAEYMLYQNLVGAWPIESDRLAAFMAKATKEAKVHTSWTDPDTGYDESLESFVRAVLDDGVFLAELESFLAGSRLVERGYRNGLAQVALLCTCPGVADLYQGNELWDLSLVDPDNRRPVDYEVRRQALARLERGEPGQLPDGSAKLQLVRALLRDRRQHPAEYLGAPYEPLEVEGPAAGSLIAFKRSSRAVLVACRSTLGEEELKSTTVRLPGRRGRNLVTGEATEGGRASSAELLGRLPVAVLATSPD